MKIITDAAQAIRITKEIRSARKQGQTVKAASRIPLYNCGSWVSTLEQPLFYDKPEELRQTVKAAFLAMPPAAQRMMTYTPEVSG